MKQGYSLRAIDGFDPRTLSILRNELSVTTAEEFLHAAAAYPDRVARLLGADRGAVDHYVEAAAAALGSEEVEAILHPRGVDYPFRTGHDAPGTGSWRDE